MSIVNFVKFHGISVFHISLTKSMNFIPIGLSRVVASIIGTFMDAKIDFISWLFSLSISRVFPLSRVSGGTI